MKGKYIVIIIALILLTVGVACNNNTNENGERIYESRVKVSASVQLKSGESQPLANAELLLLDYSLLEKMKLIEREVRKEFDLGGLEEAVRQEINYYPQKNALDKKINNALDYFNNTMNHSKSSLQRLEARERNLLSTIKTPFHKYITAAYSNSGERNRKLRQLASKRDWDSVYFLFINESRNAQSLGSEAKTAFNQLQQSIDKNQKEFNQISKQILYHRKIVKTLPDDTSRKLDIWRGEIEKLKEQVNLRTIKARDEVMEVVTQRCLEFWNTAEKTPIKTDEDGIANFRLINGKHWIVGITEIDDEKIIWDVPFEIKGNKTKVAINSKNKADIRNPQIRDIIVTALESQKPEESSEKSL